MDPRDKKTLKFLFKENYFLSKFFFLLTNMKSGIIRSTHKKGVATVRSPVGVTRQSCRSKRIFPEESTGQETSFMYQFLSLHGEKRIVIISM